MSDAQVSGSMQCTAYGCPCWPVYRRGSGWLCAAHAAVDDACAWPLSTAYLRAHHWLIKALARAQAIDPYDWVDHAALDAAAYVSRHGRPDLAPRVRLVERIFRDRLTGADVCEALELNECKSAPLWIGRVRGQLYGEAIAAGSERPTRKPVEDVANSGEKT